MSTIQSLSVSIVQSDILWEEPALNLESISRAIGGCTSDLVVLPEMCCTGFSMSPERIAQDVCCSQIVETITAMAIEHQRAVIFSAAIMDGGEYYNRLFFISPTGENLYYNKRHLFSMAGEDNHYTAGGIEKLIVEYRGFRICPMVCYDLRFPVYSRRTAYVDYDVLVYIASWPAARRYAWDTLLRARAIENQAYCIGANRVGSDPKNEYSGGSVALDFMGQPLAIAQDSTVETISAVLDKESLDSFRSGFNALSDSDNFLIQE